ncbi:phospholipase D-like domain-containing protein [Pseudomonas viridiflava]|uniref:phospholipase D-like domain-containing protein n=1 Tax=Pseudomonas TaxID=286 RepID=UPI000C07F87B|nr:phospholipase D-like domain-containing protein [Pseudomonas viridiflava]MEE4310119.1 phospholipase D-like domain-containing protein [Pseudomonas alliivorans]MEE4750342.1 phospholipase D-like domain-containing protein [Pseudomonas alliivorans]MEE4897321.1 phospholipase D-like domain-containing protein [Pseudomonas alliivorans]MEE5107938.1 phospholipase D-like domain-containing protein [Pseudomonas alliivorans]MEE5172024.1 phospholipase D-like domain-containing protein [Pseudomonas alliivoran
MTTSSITTPIATRKGMSCNINLPWFVQGTEYCPTDATFEPLVNGERAFGALYDSVMAAKNSIEMICWGFQPSMYFKRGGTSSLTIGQLLALKAEEGVKVRILCWSDSLHVTAAFAENMTPGRNLASWKSDLRSDFQRTIDWEWYRRATKSTLGTRSVLAEPKSTLLATAFSLGKEALKNIEFVPRDMGLVDRIEIAWQVAIRSADANRSTWNKAITAASMAAVPTHHQKMVLIDYETPASAIGFVMGHNTLDAYWDKDDHSAVRMDAHLGRNGATPRQDISSRVTGPILEYLNHNFAQAWLRETGVDLLTPRKAIADKLKTRSGYGPKMMAQVLRTQPQENKRDIRDLYLKAAGNVTKFMYLENQYFRWPPLAEKIKENVQRQFAEGRSLSKHGPIYLFVVTNSSEEGMGDGTINTYRMLKQLGRPDVIPVVSRQERNRALEAEVARAKERYDTAKGKITIIEGTYGSSFNPAMSKLWEPQRKAATQAEAEYRALKAKLPAESAKAVNMESINGLKVLVCTLVAPDSPPESWMDVYIHSKLAIIDDVFTTLGSSNINTRSMEVDSELNICVEEPAITKPLRKHLWGIHTNQQGNGEDIGKAFDIWTETAVYNAALRLKSKDRARPTASLTEFRRDSPSRTYKD